MNSMNITHLMPFLGNRLRVVAARNFELLARKYEKCRHCSRTSYLDGQLSCSMDKCDYIKVICFDPFLYERSLGEQRHSLSLHDFRCDKFII